MVQEIGKLLMFGFEGMRPSKFILDAIRKEGLGGVILFKRNIESIGQLKSLTQSLQDAAGGKLLIGIDQEGGRVARLPASFISIPPMVEFGKGYEESGSTEEVYALGRELGEKLISVGINLNFAPVLDVHTNPANPIIGDRSFSSNPQIVAELGLTLVRGMIEEGLVPCGKHFPGHGDTMEDSHLALPHLSYDRNRLNRIELVPFRRAVENRIPALMSAHIVYDQIDPDFPATLSRKIATDLLRGELGFEGVLFSDDLEMRAIADHYGMGTAAVQAINAGCDILLVCRTEPRQREAVDAVKGALDEEAIPSTRSEEAVLRVRRITGN